MKKENNKKALSIQKIHLKSFDLCLILFSTGFMKSGVPCIEPINTFLVFILQRLMVFFFKSTFYGILTTKNKRAKQLKI